MSRVHLLDQDTQDFCAQAMGDLRQHPDPDQGIRELLVRVNERMGTQAMSIFVLSEAGDELVVRYAATPESQAIVGLRMPFGQGVVGWVVKYSEDLIVPATARDPRFFSGVDERTGFVTHSILCVPIIWEEETHGAIEALNKTSGNFDSDDVLLLQAIAEAVAGNVAKVRP